MGERTDPREHGLMLQGPLVCQVLAGRKTETRRPVTQARMRILDRSTGKPRPRPQWLSQCIGDGRIATWRDQPAVLLLDHIDLIAVPHVRAGDRLWVRETWGPCDEIVDGYTRDEPVCVRFAADQGAYRFEGAPHRQPVRLHTHRFPAGTDDGRWKPALLMPRWAARLVLTVEQVRVEHLSALTDEDATAEGIDGGRHGFMKVWDSMYRDTVYRSQVDPLVLVYRWVAQGAGVAHA